MHPPDLPMRFIEAGGVHRVLQVQGGLVCHQIKHSEDPYVFRDKLEFAHTF